jgi:hypothetical protein
VLLEEFKNCVPNDIKNHLEEHKIETLENAALAADEYSLTHKVPVVVKTFTQQSTVRKVFQPNTTLSKTQSGTNSKNQASERLDSKSLSLPTCTYCKKKGHVISDCFKLKYRHQNQDRPIPNALISKRSRSRSCIESNTFVGSNKPQSDFIMENYEPFMSKGSISLLGDSASLIPIKILKGYRSFSESFSVRYFAFF